MTRRTFSLGLVCAAACGAGGAPSASSAFKVTKTDAEWRAALEDMEYYVLRKKGTERAFTGRGWDEHRPGRFLCAGCGTPVFSSDAKFDSGTGWPSFWRPIAPEAVATEADYELFVPRTEVHCATCGGHLGHVFDDGPRPTGQRWCINGWALDFVPAKA